jgi:hypothetical protein
MQARMNKVVGVAIGSSALIYQVGSPSTLIRSSDITQVIGIMGYVTFGSKVTANVMDLYPHSLFVSICRFAIVLLVLFGYPLQVR